MQEIQFLLEQLRILSDLLEKEISLDEVFESKEKINFDLLQEETGYFLLKEGKSYQIYPMDNQKETITDAIFSFIEREYIHYFSREVKSTSIKWLDFDSTNTSGRVEVTLFFA